MTAALELAEQGFKVHLVEKTDKLGGNANRISQTIEGLDVQKFLQKIVERVTKHERINLHMLTEVESTEGFVGNFITHIKSQATGKVQEIKHGITIIATGAQEFKPHGLYKYGKHPCILTSLELSEAIAQSKEQFRQIDCVVMIQCVGSRDEKRPYCSRTCCTLAIKNALALKKINPNMHGRPI